MNKLLSADFTRLWKNKVFWLGAACMALLACWIICIGYGQNVRWADDDIGFEPNRLDAYLFQFAPMIGGFAAVIISLFLGADYSDGTIRNKLIVGSRRRDIYLSNLVVCTAASLICMAAYLICAFAVGIPLLGVPTADARMVLACILLCVLFTTAFSSIFTMLGMLNHNRAGAAVLAILVFLALLFAASYCYNLLQIPEMSSAVIFTANGMEVGDPQPNPDYVEGEMRNALQFIVDFLPAGQGILIASYEGVHLWQMGGYSVLITAATTLLGLFGFSRKDIK